MNKENLVTLKKSALIGYTGFVGGVLAKQNDFTDYYNSKNISEIEGKEFDIIVCAGAPGQKWLANKEPREDLEAIQSLIESIKSTLRFEKLVLISTVDVYGEPFNVVESSMLWSNQPYGENRAYLENELVSLYGDKVLIVRLPGLFGEGLKKNAIFDLLNNNNIEDIPINGVLQYYDMDLLSFHIADSLKRGLKIVNLGTEPISNLEIVEKFFPEKLGIAGKNNNKTFKYDMQTITTESRYVLSREEVFERLGNFIKNYENRNI